MPFALIAKPNSVPVGLTFDIEDSGQMSQIFFMEKIKER